ncbi:MAG TPA: tRNA uridine-5-carboxymethylaminomethyl(34) synthesis GTPase MnmE [Candidatus Omnitrophota bacterium]|nr:tRNA uridine-5-carboxymethylaminomethyl(34) synthesis GTPase MnmE [Candidatus Omnitrophota bacterium]HRY85003.1 tRNA uridine-5-carboxymethylaminomethyl(34) synthesis GTPase MnmE [Candidatus Omnitrophota bacterium]
MSRFELDDTIAAIATPAGEGGIAVIRVSGPGVFDAVDPFFISHENKKLRDRSANTIHWGKFTDPSGLAVDQVLVSIFKAPQSYTGQDVIEISCHGGLAVTRKILGVLLEKGVRHAEPGEFTRRAFLAGKIDLTQAEAVLDLIRAKSDRSLEIAACQLSGSLSRAFKELKEKILRLLAHMEAYLDFPEEDLEVDVKAGMQKQFTEILEKIRSLLSGFERNARLREGIVVALAGKPNVGKSSIFNALLERDRAIVSELPHTTRDHLEEPLEIGGVYLRLRDTAGLISTPEHPLDKIGMDRTLETLQESYLILDVIDGSAPLDETDKHVLSQVPENKKKVILVNKSDLPLRIKMVELKAFAGKQPLIRLSAKTREGFKELEESITRLLERGAGSEGEQITRLRHQKALEATLDALLRAESSFRKKTSFEFITPDLHVALGSVKELIGEVYSEDLLDVIFSEFCIGK